MAAHAFTTDLFQAAAETRPGNLDLSPDNARTALGLALLGAKGPTAAQLSTVLGLPTDPQLLAAQVKQESQAWLAAKGAARLEAAAALWPDTSFPLTASYLSDSQAAYGANPEPLDLRHDLKASTDRINHWASDHTQAMIPTLLQPGDLTADTALVLTSAVFFKGLWQAPFNAANTAPALFATAPGASVSVPMMKQEGSFGYAQVGDVQIAELPYQSSHLALLVLLPTDAQGLGKLEGELSALLPDLKLEHARLDLWLPRFQFSTRSLLKAPLQRLGLGLPFDAQADFSGLTREQLGPSLHIGEVIQQARVQVDEAGTVAAAATAVLMKGGLAVRPGPPPVIFHADRPFLFVIRDTTTGRILFLGRVANPS